MQKQTIIRLIRLQNNNVTAILLEKDSHFTKIRRVKQIKSIKSFLIDKIYINTKY